jgi:lipoprotein-anchoring transpeptidase ErfK/SrfK
MGDTSVLVICRVLVICQVLVICLTGISGSVLAQDCGPFFWLCQRPAEPHVQQTFPGTPVEPRINAPTFGANFEQQYLAIYGPVRGEPFPVHAIRLTDIDPRYLRTAVSYPSNEAPGTIVIDPQNRFLYSLQGSGRALRYGVGVGKQGFSWSGIATIRNKQEWPDWYPPKEMIQRKPDDLLPDLSSFIRRVCSGYAPAWGVLRTQLV